MRKHARLTEFHANTSNTSQIHVGLRKFGGREGVIVPGRWDGVRIEDGEDEVGGLKSGLLLNGEGRRGVDSVEVSFRGLEEDEGGHFVKGGVFEIQLAPTIPHGLVEKGESFGGEPRLK